MAIPAGKPPKAGNCPRIAMAGRSPPGSMVGAQGVNCAYRCVAFP